MTKQERFEKAVKQNDIETVKELLKDSEVDPGADDNQAIGKASQNGHVEVVRLLLDDVRVDPEANVNYAIGYAALNGHVEVVRLLLDDDRVDPADDNNWAIRYAIKNGHDEVADMLYYDYRICHQQLVLDIIKRYEYIEPTDLIKKLIDDTDLQICHPDNESLDGKISSLDLIKELYNADEETKQAFVECGFDQNLFTFISLL